MGTFKVLFRDVDRTPYLFALRQSAARRGLELLIEQATPSNPGWADRLASGAIDVLAENYWGLQGMRAKGAPLITVASVVNRMTETLLAGPSVTSVTDLRGKSFAVRGAGPQLFLPGLWLGDMGLAADVQQAVITEQESGRWGNWKKVVSGEHAACFLANLYADEPIAAGLHEVPYDPYFFEGMNVTLTLTESNIAGRRADVQTLVDATFDTTEMFRRDEAAMLRIMQDECLEPLREHFEIPDERKLRRLYEILRDELAETPVPNPRGIVNALRVVRGESAGRPRRDVATYEDDLVPESFNPMLMWDLSFARAALRARA